MKEIKLKNSNSTLMVDDIDFDLVSKHNWFLTSNGRNIICHLPNRTTVSIGRLLLGITDSSSQVDHVNQNIFDNRKTNLRVATASQNGMNRSKLNGCNSKFKGVTKARNKWQARITVNRKTIHIGSFDSEQEAAIAYNGPSSATR